MFMKEQYNFFWLLQRLQYLLEVGSSRGEHWKIVQN